MGDVFELRRTYRARLETVDASGLTIKIAGTLDGCIDFAVIEGDGASRTYSILPNEAANLATALSRVVSDIKTNCLYDRDILLKLK
jgi:hypothetical protein